MLHWAHQPWHQNQWTVSVFHNFWKKHAPFWSKIRLSRGFSPWKSSFFHSFLHFSAYLSSFLPFFDVFSTFLRKIPRKREEDVAVAAVPTSSTWRPWTAMSEPSGTSSAWRRSAWTRNIRQLAGGLKRLRLNCLFRWCCGLKVPEDDPKILKFGVNRNFWWLFDCWCIFGISRLLMIIYY